MDAVEYIREKKRMCKMCRRCYGCNLKTAELNCVTYEAENPEKAVEIVEKWSVENSVHTYFDEFKKRFPKNTYKSFDEIRCCVNDIFGTNYICDYDSTCEKCWRLEYKGE